MLSYILSILLLLLNVFYIVLSWFLSFDLVSMSFHLYQLVQGPVLDSLTEKNIGPSLILCRQNQPVSSNWHWNQLRFQQNQIIPKPTKPSFILSQNLSCTLSQPIRIYCSDRLHVFLDGVHDLRPTTSSLGAAERDSRDSLGPHGKPRSQAYSRGHTLGSLQKICRWNSL